MAIDESGTIDVASLTRLITAFAESRLLHSAVEVGVFELLADGPLRAWQIRQRLDLHPRLVPDFLDALVAAGLLIRTGEEYANTPPAQRFLVPGGPVYLGGRIRTAARRHYHTWGRLTEALRDGKPKSDTGPDAFDAIYTDPVQAKGFLVHMDANNAAVAPQLAEVVDWSQFGSFVDVGGARGNVAGTLVRAHPHLHGGVFELPAVEPFFDELMAEFGTSAKVTFHSGDFFADPMPQTEVVILGHVLHDWPVERREALLAAAFQAVPVNGAVVVYDQMLDPASPDLRSLIGSLNVALITRGGCEYTAEDCRIWLEKAGFTLESVSRLPRGNDTVVVARRRA